LGEHLLVVTISFLIPKTRTSSAIGGLAGFGRAVFLNFNFSHRVTLFFILIRLLEFCRKAEESFSIFVSWQISPPLMETFLCYPRVRSFSSAKKAPNLLSQERPACCGYTLLSWSRAILRFPRCRGRQVSLVSTTFVVVFLRPLPWRKSKPFFDHAALSKTNEPSLVHIPRFGQLAYWPL